MSQPTFKFISEAVGGSQFTVVSFSAYEAISALYRYQIELKVPLSVSLDLDDILNSPARFITDEDGQEFPVYGVLSSIEELQTVQGYVHYRSVLVPRLWWLSNYKTNEIYSDPGTTIDVIIEEILSRDFSSGLDYDLDNLNTSHFLQRDYRCQFGESDFDFISRLMENEGVFYYFDQSGSNEKIIFIHNQMYEDLPSPALTYDVTVSTSQPHDSIYAWSCRKQRLAEKVKVRDFNPYHPSLDISYTETIDSMGQGTEYFYGDNVEDDTEAMYLSGLRAEESRCLKTRYYGEGSVSRLHAGYVFELSGHPNSQYNDLNYLTLEVNHEGRNLDLSLNPSDDSSLRSQYSNSFTAIESSEQFRPRRKTPKPRFYGTMTAFVHAAQGTNDVEINPDGRYLVHLPFDGAGGAASDDDATNRKVSAWLRMAQPFAGPSEGMYFPLKGGTEVLLTFINGDPDQPIISAALPNAAEPSLLNSQNDTETVIQTRGGNRITLKDDDNNEQERIVLQSPVQNTSLRLGGMDKDGSDDVGGIQDVSAETDGIQLKTDKDYVLKVAENNKQTAILNNEIESTSGLNKITAHSGNAILSGATASIQTAMDDLQQEIANQCGIDPVTQQPKAEADKTDQEKAATAENALARNILYSEGSTRIESGKSMALRADTDFNLYGQGETIKFEMLSDKLVIDAGEKDIEIKCNKFNLDNSKEDNVTWGNDFAFHGGGAEEIFLGGKVEVSVAESFEFYLGLKQEIAIAATLEIFGGAKFEFAAGFAMEGYLGYAIEMKFAGLLEVSNVVKIEKGPGEQKLEFTGGKFTLDGADISDGKVSIRSGLLAIFA